MPEQNAENERAERLRTVAARKGLQLRRSDSAEGYWHIVHPEIDGKLYGFSFTHPHSYTLDEVEKILAERPDLPQRS